MALSLKEIKAPISAELSEFEDRFKASMKSQVPLLDRITYYIIQKKGKQMRPMFVFFCAKIFGEICDKTYRGASLIELLHTATLVHDDVVDNAEKRRGFFSINALWKNKIAVLVGDYLLSKGLLLSLDNDDFKALKILSSAVKAMSEGELLQLEKSRLLNITEADYYKIIQQKTASLISSACSVGVASVTEDESKIKLAHDFGEALGMAFQIRDDLFDISKNNSGKPNANDIKEKKLTLPLIHALSKSDLSTQRKIKKIIRSKKIKQADIDYIIQFIYAKDGVGYTNQVMENYQNKAFELLDQFPNNEAKEGLLGLINYTVSRNK